MAVTSSPAVKGRRRCGPRDRSPSGLSPRCGRRSLQRTRNHRGHTEDRLRRGGVTLLPACEFRCNHCYVPNSVFSRYGSIAGLGHLIGNRRHPDIGELASEAEPRILRLCDLASPSLKVTWKSHHRHNRRGKTYCARRLGSLADFVPSRRRRRDRDRRCRQRVRIGLLVQHRRICKPAVEANAWSKSKPKAATIASASLWNNLAPSTPMSR